MKLIDIHTHIYPPAIARKAAASIREFYQLGTDEMDGTADTLLQKGTEAGIDRFVIRWLCGRTEPAISTTLFWNRWPSSPVFWDLVLFMRLWTISPMKWNISWTTACGV